MSTQILDFLVMFISRYEDTIVLQSKRCDPNIIFRNGATFYPQNIFDLSISITGICITVENLSLRYKFRHRFAIFFRAL